MSLFSQKSSKQFVWFGIAIFIFFFLLFLEYEKYDLTKVAQFGDFIGGVVGSLWSLAGLILIYLAFVNQQESTKSALEAVETQRRALEMQSEELKLQRDELKESRKVYQEQSETMRFQRFENTFFSLVEVHNSIVNSMDFEYTYNIGFKPTFYSGRDVFAGAYDAFKKDLDHSEYKELNKAYVNRVWPEVQTDFGHYFRNLYRIIKFVEESNVFDEMENPDLEKYKYTSIIRAQLSDHELLWLFYNCVTENGKERFKPLVEKYSLLKNIPVLYLKKPNHMELMNPSARFPSQNEYYNQKITTNN